MLKRSKSACFERYMAFLLPILKTDALNLGHGLEWMKDFLKYIVQNKIADPKQIKYNHVVKEVCPGQTSHSLRNVCKSLSQECQKDYRMVRIISYDKKQIRSKKPFHEICANRLDNPDPSSYLGGGNLKEKKSKYIKEVLGIKRNLLNNRQ